MGLTFLVPPVPICEHRNFCVPQDVLLFLRIPLISNSRSRFELLQTKRLYGEVFMVREGNKRTRA